MMAKFSKKLPEPDLLPLIFHEVITQKQVMYKVSYCGREEGYGSQYTNCPSELLRSPKSVGVESMREISKAYEIS